MSYTSLLIQTVHVTDKNFEMSFGDGRQN